MTAYLLFLDCIIMHLRGFNTSAAVSVLRRYHKMCIPLYRCIYSKHREMSLPIVYAIYQLAVSDTPNLAKTYSNMQYKLIYIIFYLYSVMGCRLPWCELQNIQIKPK